MKYAYEDMNEDQFERLVVCICRYLLGIGVQGFAKGPDGGRDAKFVGTAEQHPSKAAPWVGTTIIQAKHTTGYNKNFSEGDFYSKTSQKFRVSKNYAQRANSTTTCWFRTADLPATLKVKSGSTLPKNAPSRKCQLR